MDAQDVDVEGVYLLHFERPYKHAQHYIGWSIHIGKRVKLHQTGQSKSRLTQAAARAGIKMEVVKIWQGLDRNGERRLKMQRAAKRMCPVCNPGNNRGKKER